LVWTAIGVAAATFFVMWAKRWRARAKAIYEADRACIGSATQQLLTRHTTAVDFGNLDAILADYARNAVLLTPEGTHRGRAEIRAVWEKLLADVFTADAKFTMVRQAVEGDIAFIVWSVESKGLRIPLATDTYLVQDGKIVVQTYAAMVETKGKT
jgi:hypothetical protein